MEELQWAEGRESGYGGEGGSEERVGTTAGRAGTHSGISPLALPISGVLHWRSAAAALSQQTISYKRVVNYLHRARENAHPLFCEAFPRLPFLPPIRGSSLHLSRHGVTTPRVKETNAY